MFTHRQKESEFYVVVAETVLQIIDLPYHALLVVCL